MPLKILLIGAGHMGRIHLEKLKDLEDVQVTGVVDTDTKLVKELSEKHQVPWFSHYGEPSDVPDGVVIATPTETHYEIAKTFLEKGVHVFLEKPITLRLDEAKRLVELANEMCVGLQVGHLERFNPPFTKAASLITHPVYMEACRASGFTGRSTDIDVVLDLMIHDIDLILSLARADVRDIRAQGISLVMGKLDMVNARIEFADGCVANLTANRVSTRKERMLSVFEKDRYFTIDLLHGKLICTLRHGQDSIENREYMTEKVDAVKYELSEFVHSIRSSTNPCVRGEDGLKALIIANQIKQYIAERTSP